MSANLTPTQRLTCLLALLDDAIKKDEERTHGEWMKGWGPTGERTSFVCGDPSKHDIAHEVLLEDASFIASASVSHGRNARALRAIVQWLRDELMVSAAIKQLEVHEIVSKRLNSILSIYPDEILKRYLPK